MLKNYDLGHKWSHNSKDDIYEKQVIQDKQVPQILFIERCLQLLKPGGRLGIVLLESIFGMPKYRYVVDYLQRHTQLLAIVTMPEDLFQPYTHAKCCVVVCEKRENASREPYDIFMAEVKWCGHDSRGNPTITKNAEGKDKLLDDIPPPPPPRLSIISRRSQRMIAFWKNNREIVERIYIPKYYDPTIRTDLSTLSETHTLRTIGDMTREGFFSASTGDEIGKMAYGTGDIPFVRTSDISNWEIKSIPKQGISEEIFSKYSEKQDVRTGDILLVRDGTYLIGTDCFVSSLDTKILYQSHILKFRLNPSSAVDPHLLFLALSSDIVQRQIRSFQFTADTIDTIGNRYLDIVLPVPKSNEHREKLVQDTEQALSARVVGKAFVKQAPFLLEEVLKSGDAVPLHSFLSKDIAEIEGELTQDTVTTEFGHFKTFWLKNSMVKQRIMLPKYYNSEISESEEIYRTCAVDQDLQINDLLLVRDGTYLVGSSCIVTELNRKALFCAGLYKIRSTVPEELNPFLLLGLLNSYIVKRQIRTKQFTRDVIDTIGQRLKEVVLPVPHSQFLRDEITQAIRGIVYSRVKARQQISVLSKLIESEDWAPKQHDIRTKENSSIPHYEGDEVPL